MTEQAASSSPLGGAAATGAAAGAAAGAAPAAAAAGAAPAAGAGAPAAGAPAAGQGGAVPAWLHQFAEPHRAALAAKGFDKPDALAEAFIKLDGSKGLQLPGKDAKPGDWDPVWNALGRPEKPDGYDLKAFNKPEGWNDQAATDFLKAAHTAGLNQQQAVFALEHYRDFTLGQMALAQTEQQAARTRGLDELKAGWGVNFAPNLDKAKTAVRALAQAALGEQAGAAGQFLDESGLGWHPGLVKMFATLHDHLQLGEDGALVKGGTGAGAGGAAGAKAQIEALERAAAADPKHPLINRDHPEHKDTVKRRAELYALAHPGVAAGAAPSTAAVGAS